MKKFAFFAVAIMFIFLFSVASVTTRYELGDKYGTLYYFETVEIDTTITDTFTYTFDISSYQTQSVQLRITSVGDTIVLKYKCSPEDSTSYWDFAVLESIDVIITGETDTVVETWSDATLAIPLSRYIKFYILPDDTSSIDFDIFFNFQKD